MQQILSVWSTLDNRRRMIVLGATIAMFAAILGLSRMASQPTLSLLYAGLEPAIAGDVVAALEAQNVAYDVRDGAIFVEAAQRDALRMTLQKPSRRDVIRSRKRLAHIAQPGPSLAR